MTTIRSTNQVCVLTLAEAPSGSFAITLPTVTLAVEFQGPDGVRYDASGVPDSDATLVLLQWEGSGYNTSSLDIVSGPGSPLVLDFILDAWPSWSDSPLWSGDYQEWNTAGASFNTQGTYTVRITVANDAGSVTDEVTFTVVDSGEEVIIPPDPDPEYVLSMNSYPWVTDTIDGISFTRANVRVDFTINNDGTFDVKSDFFSLTPSPDQYQWIYEAVDPPNKPIPGTVTDDYEVMFQVVSPDQEGGAYKPWPWNWWYSKGFLTWEQQMEGVNRLVEGNNVLGGAPIGEWLPLTSSYSWLMDIPFYEPNDPVDSLVTESIQPFLVTISIRKTDLTAGDGATFTIGLGPAE